MDRDIQNQILKDEVLEEDRVASARLGRMWGA